jgi:hypothetical protein
MLDRERRALVDRGLVVPALGDRGLGVPALGDRGLVDRGLVVPGLVVPDPLGRVEADGRHACSGVIRVKPRARSGSIDA